MDDEVRRHQVDLVGVAAADQIEAGRQCPQDAPTVAVELVVLGGGTGRRHPKMPPTPEFPEFPDVVVVTGAFPSMALMRWITSW